MIRKFFLVRRASFWKGDSKYDPGSRKRRKSLRKERDGDFESAKKLV